MKTTLTRIQQFILPFGKVTIREFNPKTNANLGLDIRVKPSRKDSIRFIEEFSKYLEGRVTPANYSSHLLYEKEEKDEQIIYRFEVSPEANIPVEDYEEVNSKIIRSIPHMLKDFGMKNGLKKDEYDFLNLYSSSSNCLDLNTLKSTQTYLTSVRYWVLELRFFDPFIFFKNSNLYLLKQRI